MATSVISCPTVMHTCKRNKWLMTINRSKRRSASEGTRLHRLTRTGTMKSLSCAWAQLTPIPAPTEPFSKVVCQYTDTLCATQKQTNLTNSLL